jgi:hypothetical protein
MSTLPTLKPQEIPFDHSESCNYFQPGPDKPFVATPRAIEAYQSEVIIACLRVLQDQAILHNGLDYLQVFEAPDDREDLWYIEDGPGGAITALLPTDY